jgi:hypothetical protein
MQIVLCTRKAVSVVLCIVLLLMHGGGATNAEADLPGDPALCATADPNEKKLGAFVYASKLDFAKETKFKDLYSRLIVTTEICTDKALSSEDRSALKRVLNTLGIKDAQTFLATLSVTFTAATGPKFPSLVPFSYTFDEDTGTYEVQTEVQRNLPWQTTNHGYNLKFEYGANQKTTIGIGKLASGIITQIAGANPSTMLVSQTTSNFINVGANIIDQVASSALSNKNVSTSHFALDLVTQFDRGVIFRFRDTDNKPLAAVKAALVLTNSLGNPKPLRTAEKPKFEDYPPILGVSPGGPLSGLLGDNIAKDENYKAVISANKETEASVFARACDNLQDSLRKNYGLNPYDETLAMALILYSVQGYFDTPNLATSRCFKNPATANVGLLKEMGLKFDKAMVNLVPR